MRAFRHSLQEKARQPAVLLPLFVDYSQDVRLRITYHGCRSDPSLYASLTGRRALQPKLDIQSSRLLLGVVEGLEVRALCVRTLLQVSCWATPL